MFMFEIILLSMFFLVLCITSYSDIKTKEIPDWVNFAAIAAAIGMRVIYGAITWEYQPILSGVLGFALFYALAYAMFYTGQWGGGDSKLLMAAGAFLGFEFNLETRTFAFLIALLISGAVYGTIWSVVLAVKNKKQFFKTTKNTLNDKKFSRIHKLVFIASILLLFAAIIFKEDRTALFALLFLAVFQLLFFYLFIMIKSVENCCMIKLVEPAMLTEGDWVAKDVIVKGKKMCGPDDLGISKAQIRKLVALRKQNKISKVMLKTGIPFVPSFLLAFLIMIKFGNILLMVMK